MAGPSGSGKTTVLNLLGGLTRPSRGKVWIARPGDLGTSGQGAGRKYGFRGSDLSSNPTTCCPC